MSLDSLCECKTPPKKTMVLAGQQNKESVALSAGVCVSTSVQIIEDRMDEWMAAAGPLIAPARQHSSKAARQ